MNGTDTTESGERADRLSVAERRRDPGPHWLRTHAAPLVFAVCIAILCVASALWIVAKTSHGLTGGDAASYVGMARELRSGHGPMTPFLERWDRYDPGAFFARGGRVASTEFPPGYPIVLAATSVVTSHLSSTARLLAIALLPLNLLLMALLTARMVALRAWLIALAPSFLLVLLPDTRKHIYGADGWLLTHATIASEPLFIALFLSALLALAHYLRTERGRRAWLLLVVILSASCVLTRWLGISVVATVVFALVAVDRRNALGRRLLRATWVGVACVAPALSFIVWGGLAGGGSGSGPGLVSYHKSSDGVSKLLRLAGIYVSGGTGSYVSRYAVLLVLAIGLAGLLAISAARGGAAWRQSPDATAVIVVVVVAVCLFAATALFAEMFLGQGYPLDARVLAPIRGLVYALVVSVLYWTLAEWIGARRAVVGIAVVIVAAVVPAVNTQSYVLKHWRQTPPVATKIERIVRRLSSNTVVATDDTGREYLTTGRHVVTMPSWIDYRSGNANRRFGRQTDALVETLRARGGYVVWNATTAIFMLTPERLGDRVNLELVAKVGTKTLYRIRRN